MPYLAVILDPASVAKVKRFATLPNVHAHHVTVAFNPGAAEMERFGSLIGQRIAFQGIRFAFDDKGEAIEVKGVPSLNAHPHVTVACAAGVRPVYSNALLADPLAASHPFCIGLSGVFTLCD